MRPEGVEVSREREKKISYTIVQLIELNQQQPAGEKSFILYFNV